MLQGYGKNWFFNRSIDTTPWAPRKFSECQYISLAKMQLVQQRKPPRRITKSNERTTPREYVLFTAQKRKARVVVVRAGKNIYLLRTLPILPQVSFTARDGL